MKSPYKYNLAHWIVYNNFGIKIDFEHEIVEMLESSYMLGKECSRWQNKVYDEDFKKMIVDFMRAKQ
jgi:hypothetical protein